MGPASGLGARIKFNFSTDGVLFIDGKGEPNQVSSVDAESDIALTVSMENFERIIDKKLNPKFALMTGKMRLRGDIRIATRLDKGVDTPTPDQRRGTGDGNHRDCSQREYNQEDLDWSQPRVVVAERAIELLDGEGNLHGYS